MVTSGAAATNKQTNEQISQAFTDVSFWTQRWGLLPGGIGLKQQPPT